MANKQFDDGLIIAFGITGGLLLFYALVITVGMLIALISSSGHNAWVTWSALPALWLGWLFMWIAYKLDV